MKTHTRIIQHLFLSRPARSVTQFSPRLMDFCSSPRSIANLRSGNEGGRGEGAQRDEQKGTLKSGTRAECDRERKRDGEKKKRRREKEVRAGEARREKKRGPGEREFHAVANSYRP